MQIYRRTRISLAYISCFRSKDKEIRWKEAAAEQKGMTKELENDDTQ